MTTMESQMTTPTCPPHHWLLGDLVQSQAKNQGTCKLCGAVRAFQEPFIDMGYNWRGDSMSQGEQEVVHYLMGRGKREV